MARVVRPPAAPSSVNRPAVARPAPAVRKPPAAAPARVGRFGRLRSQALQQTSAATFFRESFAELKKVHWPTRQQTIHMSVIVIIFSLATGVILGGVDFLFAQMVALLVGAH